MFFLQKFTTRAQTIASTNRPLRRLGGWTTPTGTRLVPKIPKIPASPHPRMGRSGTGTVEPPLQ